jgi:hypothetical protein
MSFEDPLAGLDPFSIMMMLGMGNVPSLPSAQDKYGNEEPYDLDQYAKQGNALQDDFDMMLDPSMGLMGLALGMPTFDSMTTVQPQEIEPPPMRWTPTIDRLKANPNTAWIAEQIEGGGTILDINQQIRQGVTEKRLTEEDAADMQSVAEQAMGEFGDFSRSSAEFDHNAQFRQPELSPMEQFLRKAGLPSPTEQYTKDNVQLTGPLAMSGARARYNDRRGELERTRPGAMASARTLNDESLAMRQALAQAKASAARPPEGFVNTENGSMMTPGRTLEEMRTGSDLTNNGVVARVDDRPQRAVQAIQQVAEAIGHAKKASTARTNVNDWRRQRGSTEKLRQESNRRDRVARAKTAQNMGAEGRTPFSDTMQARLAMLQMLRGGG